MNETGRPMVYSCSWPAYQTDHMVPDYKSIAKHCNLWRNWDDIQDSWTSVLSIIDWFAEHQDEFQQFAGPGKWNDFKNEYQQGSICQYDPSQGKTNFSQPSKSK